MMLQATEDALEQNSHNINGIELKVVVSGFVLLECSWSRIFVF